MSYYKKLIIEAIAVGILTIIIGSGVGYLISISKLYPMPSLPSECSTYNKYFIMETTLFFTGVFIHLFCEYFGINNWYLTNSAAAMKNI